LFFENWYNLLRILFVGTLAYTSLILVLRFSGKRTLTKMNAFDFVITVAIGSMFGTIILSKDIVLVEGIFGLSLLIFLQYLITWSSVRSDVINRLVKSEPKLLYYNDQFLLRHMKAERIMKEELLQAVRNQGIASFEDVHSVILETDGSMSIIKKFNSNSQRALENVIK